MLHLVCMVLALLPAKGFCFLGPLATELAKANVGMAPPTDTSACQSVGFPCMRTRQCQVISLHLHLAGSSGPWIHQTGHSPVCQAFQVK